MQRRGGNVIRFESTGQDLATSARVADRSRWRSLAPGRQAIGEVTAALQLNPELDPELIGQSLVLARRYDDALAAVCDWPDGASRSQCLALIYHAVGRKSDSESALSDLIMRFGTTDPFRVAEVYAYRGEREAAFEWIHAGSRGSR